MTVHTPNTTNDMNATDTRVSTETSPWGNAAIAGAVSLVANVILTWVLSLIIPPAQALDMGWTLTMVGIMSFFAGLFSYYGAVRQIHSRTF